MKGSAACRGHEGDSGRKQSRAMKKEDKEEEDKEKQAEGERHYSVLQRRGM